MIQNDLKTVNVLSYANTTDAYGQYRTGTATTRTAEMAIYIYSQKEVQDPRYNECEFIGLTKDKEITTGNEIQDGSKKYQVLHLIPSKRFITVLLRQMK